VIGAFVRRPSVGSVALVSATASTAAQRVDILHDYAHAVFEPDQATVVTTPFNVDELIQRRASSFAVAFLLPVAGVEAAIAKLGKGRPSRKTHAVIGREMEKPARAESRSTPGSQTLTYRDVAAIAQEFGSSYRAMTYRLEALGILAEVEAKKLRTPTRVQAARDYVVAFHHDRRADGDRSVELKRYVVHLAIEAHRRRLIDTAALSSLAAMLSIDSLSEAKLLKLAEAAR
jgi:Zn-dependent peptidase ImmA (M78 family)